MIPLDPTAFGCFATLIVSVLVLLGAVCHLQAEVRHLRRLLAECRRLLREVDSDRRSHP